VLTQHIVTAAQSVELSISYYRGCSSL